MSEILGTLAQLSVLIFVISSMLSMGLSLTTGQIIGPLKNAKLVALALVANFVLIPIIVYMYYVVIESWCLGYALSYLFGWIDLGEDPARRVHSRAGRQ